MTYKLELPPDIKLTSDGVFKIKRPGFEVAVHSRKFCECNILEAQVGTNCPGGGDTGHGGRTVFRLVDHAGTDMRCGVNGESPESVSKIEIVFGGDSECDTFIKALEFALGTLRSQIRKETIR